VVRQGRQVLWRVCRELKCRRSILSFHPNSFKKRLERRRDKVDVKDKGNVERGEVFQQHEIKVHSFPISEQGVAAEP
jgi:hypothetical protein